MCKPSFIDENSLTKLSTSEFIMKMFDPEINRLKELKNLDLSEVDFSGKNILVKRNFDGWEINNVIFSRFNSKSSEKKSLYGLSFKGAKMNKVSFVQAFLDRCNFDWEKEEQNDKSIKKLVENQRFGQSEELKTNITNKEILMSIDDLKYESSCLKKLVYGEEAEKLEVLAWLKAHYSWDAKRWIQGMLFDDSPEVRATAAEYIADIQYLTYLPDVRAAYNAETDEAAQKRIGASLDRLKRLKK